MLSSGGILFLLKQPADHRSAGCTSQRQIELSPWVLGGIRFEGDVERFRLGNTPRKRLHFLLEENARLPMTLSIPPGDAEVQVFERQSGVSECKLEAVSGVCSGCIATDCLGIGSRQIEGGVSLPRFVQSHVRLVHHADLVVEIPVPRTEVFAEAQSRKSASPVIKIGVLQGKYVAS